MHAPELRGSKGEGDRRERALRYEAFVESHIASLSHAPFSRFVSGATTRRRCGRVTEILGRTEQAGLRGVRALIEDLAPPRHRPADVGRAHLESQQLRACAVSPNETRVLLGDMARYST